MVDLGVARVYKNHVRGLPLSCVLQGCGKLFQDPVGSDATFALSSQVNHLDAFLSHTWSTPRWRKFMALSMHYNFMKALCIAVSFGVVVGVLVTMEVLPVFTIAPGGWHERHPSAPYALVLVSVSFHVFLHVVHEVLPTDSTRVFLDKACINQSDADRKMQGISNLGVACFFSWKLVVLESEEYFRRLWTVYELSSFLLRRRCELVFLPVKLPFAVCIMSLATTVAIFVSEVMKSTFVHALAPWIATLGLFTTPLPLLPTFISIPIVQRMWAREQSRRLSRLESFSISTAKCSSEDDRAPVERNIMLLLKDLGHLAVDDDRADADRADADRADALNMFDEAVRWNLPQALKDRMCIPSVFF